MTLEKIVFQPHFKSELSFNTRFGNIIIRLAKVDPGCVRVPLMINATICTISNLKIGALGIFSSSCKVLESEEGLW